jgi:hypothetical protein
MVQMLQAECKLEGRLNNNVTRFACPLQDSCDHIQNALHGDNRSLPINGCHVYRSTCTGSAAAGLERVTLHNNITLLDVWTRGNDGGMLKTNASLIELPPPVGHEWAEKLCEDTVEGVSDSKWHSLLARRATRLSIRARFNVQYS